MTPDTATTNAPELKADEINQWRQNRNKALRELDVSAVPLATPEISLCALHKARYECLDIEPELRHESRKWLQERGFKRLYGEEFLPEGELPE